MPAKTPKAVIEKLASAVTEIIREPALKDKLLTQGVEPAGGTPADFEKFLQAERQTYSTLAKERSIVARPSSPQPRRAWRSQLGTPRSPVSADDDHLSIQPHRGRA